MTSPWNKHSSTWDVPWDDREENHKVVTISYIDPMGKPQARRMVGNPERIKEEINKDPFMHDPKITSITHEENSASFMAGSIAILFWGLLFILFVKYVLV